MTMIPLLVPDLPRAEELLPYLLRIDANKKYTNFGPLNRDFEERIGAILSKPGLPVNVLTVANCTLGLELALQALGVGRGDRVLVPALTFVATATAVIRIGATPVFADVDPDTWSLTPSIARRAAKEYGLKAAIPVSTYGCALDTDDWDDFVADTGISVVVDAAGAFGNQQVGRTFDVVYSFHATKSFGIGEGGAIASMDEKRLARIKQLSNFGIDTSRSVVTEIGTNAKLSEYHCAVGLAMFDRWDAMTSERIAHMSGYLSLLRVRCPWLVFQDKIREGIYPLLTVRLPDGVSASEVLLRLANEGIDCRRWYCPPLHRHDALVEFPHMREIPTVEALGDSLLGLPYFLSMSRTQMERVAESLSRVVANLTASSELGGVSIR